MLTRHRPGLLAYVRRHLTSAGCENLNGRIQATRVAARGCRNRERFRTAVCLHCRGLHSVTDSSSG